MPKFETGNGCYLNYVVRKQVYNQVPINVLFVHGYGSDLGQWEGYLFLYIYLFNLIVILDITIYLELM